MRRCSTVRRARGSGASAPSRPARRGRRASSSQDRGGPRRGERRAVARHDRLGRPRPAGPGGRASPGRRRASRPARSSGSRPARGSRRRPATPAHGDPARPCRRRCGRRPGAARARARPARSRPAPAAPGRRGSDSGAGALDVVARRRTSRSSRCAAPGSAAQARRGRLAARRAARRGRRAAEQVVPVGVRGEQPDDREAGLLRAAPGSASSSSGQHGRVDEERLARRERTRGARGLPEARW